MQICTILPLHSTPKIGHPLGFNLFSSMFCWFTGGTCWETAPCILDAGVSPQMYSTFGVCTTTVRRAEGKVCPWCHAVFPDGLVQCFRTLGEKVFTFSKRFQGFQPEQAISWCKMSRNSPSCRNHHLSFRWLIVVCLCIWSSRRFCLAIPLDCWLYLYCWLGICRLG